MKIFSVYLFILFFHPCHLYMSSIMLNVHPQGRKIANATPYLQLLIFRPSRAENSVFTVISVPWDGK